MQVTEVRFKPANPEDHHAGPYQLLGFASVTFDDVFVIKSIRVLESNEKRLLSFPNRARRQEDGTVTFLEEAHPITAEFRRHVTEAVFAHVARMQLHAETQAA